MTCLRPRCTIAQRIPVQASLSRVSGLFAYSSERDRGRGARPFSDVSSHSRAAHGGPNADVSSSQLDSRAGPGPLTTVLHLTGPTRLGHVACSPDGIKPSSVLALSADRCWLCWVLVVTPSWLPFPAQAACLLEMTGRPFPTQVRGWPLCLRSPSVSAGCAWPPRSSTHRQPCTAPSVLDTRGATRGLSSLLTRHRQELLLRLGPSRPLQRSPLPLRRQRTCQVGSRTRAWWGQGLLRPAPWYPQPVPACSAPLLLPELFQAVRELV